MAIREALLALLAERDMYGYQLRSEFERRTGATWPLNVGQVYTTVARLVRDGLVAEVDEPREERATVRYRITDDGRAAVTRWLAEPVSTAPERDELPIKVAIAVTLPGVDVRGLLQRQRTASLRQLQDYTRAKIEAGGGDLAWQLVVESLIFRTESQIRWLDHCEARVVRAAHEARESAGHGPDQDAGRDADRDAGAPATR